MWASGAVPVCVAPLFTDAKIRPIEKTGGGVRPIVLIEALYKVASGSIQDALRAQGGEGLGDNEYCGLPGGAETMLLTGQGLITLRPEEAIVSLDASNAFGTVHRSAVIAASGQHCPRHVPMLTAT